MFSTIHGSRLTSPLLVVAPHPDDEVLAAAGLIQQALRAGHDVYVVFMTVGDGFADAVRESLHLPESKASFVQLGKLRFNEASQAMRCLGVPRSHLFFLGFPDGKLHVLEASKKTHRTIQSPITKKVRANYAFAFERGAAYSYRGVLKTLTSVVTNVKPGTVVLPHRSDTHPDHRATRRFALAAIRSTKIQPTVLSYLIHYPHYPSQRGPLIPPVALQSKRVRELTLSKSEVEQKRAAFRLHRSQYHLSPSILRFIRPTEWFWKE
jgi:LmbE family N-acetylglucosaminyl deacetylase